MAYNIGSKIVTNGLVLYLDAANSVSYPGTGDIWYDLSSYGNHATVDTANGRTMPTYNSVTKMFNFNGTTDCLQITSNTSTGTNGSSGEITIITGCDYITNGNYRYVVSNAIYGMYRVFYNQSTQRISITAVSTRTSIPTMDTSAKNINDMNIYGLQVIRTGGVQDGYYKFYFNGNYVDSTNAGFSMQTSSNRLGIGGQFNTGVGWGGNTFLGNISFIMMYNRALSDDEMQQNYNSLKARIKL